MYLKPESRFIGFDDAPFFPHQRGTRVPIVGVVMRGGEYVEGVLSGEVTVDGNDANRVLEGMLMRSRFLKQIKAVLLDGIAFGGFNVIDIYRLAERTGIPVISVTRERPEMDAIFSALGEHFEDGAWRIEVVGRGELREFPILSDGITYVLHGKCAGVAPGDAVQMLQCTINRGAYPEPLRIAHMIGSALVKGESRGRA